MISTLSRLFKFKLNSVSSFSVVGQGSHNGHLVPAEQVRPQLNGGVKPKRKKYCCNNALGFTEIFVITHFSL